MWMMSAVNYYESQCQDFFLIQLYDCDQSKITDFDMRQRKIQRLKGNARLLKDANCVPVYFCKL